MRLFTEEQFGPVIPVGTFSDVAEVREALAKSWNGQQASKLRMWRVGSGECGASEGVSVGSEVFASLVTSVTSVTSVTRLQVSLRYTVGRLYSFTGGHLHDRRQGGRTARGCALVDCRADQHQLSGWFSRCNKCNPSVTRVLQEHLPTAHGDTLADLAHQRTESMYSYVYTESYHV